MGEEKEGNPGWEHRGENAKNLTQLQGLCAAELCFEKPATNRPLTGLGGAVAGSASTVGSFRLVRKQRRAKTLACWLEQPLAGPQSSSLDRSQTLLQGLLQPGHFWHSAHFSLPRCVKTCS